MCYMVLLPWSDSSNVVLCGVTSLVRFFYCCVMWCYFPGQVLLMLCYVVLLPWSGSSNAVLCGVTSLVRFF